MTDPSKIRVLAMVYPIERHVGHWAMSSQSIELTRVIMEGENLPDLLSSAVRACRPEIVAIIGKSVKQYHDLLDDLSNDITHLKEVPRVYRCQNTVLAQRVYGADPTRESLAKLDHWFAFACDERFSLILVQTLTDVDLIQRALAPKLVVACPYGYDTAVFDPDLPDIERPIDVGCYFSLRDDPRRLRLVDHAQSICARRGWSFRFVSGKYWHDYANLIHSTKLCLHFSDRQEIPFRLYETTCLGTVFLTDPLGCGIENLFSEGQEYLTYRPDLSNLEDVLESVLVNPGRWRSLSSNGRARAREYTWASIADRYVAPALKQVLGRK